MDALEQRQRDSVVAEAKTWLRTPYHHSGRVKGAGVDCAMIIAEVYSACGLIPRVDVAQYPPDWHLNRGQELYLKYVLDHAQEVSEGLPGDLVLFRFGRCFSHGAIIVKWPTIIHAFLNCPVQQEDAARDHRLKFMGEADNRARPRKFYRLTQWEQPEKAQHLQRPPNALHGGVF